MTNAFRRLTEHINRAPTNDVAPQDAVREKWRNESVLDRRIPLGFPIFARPEHGPGVREYYARKAARGEVGRFEFHQTKGWS